jgi:hypothetical protein
LSRLRKCRGRADPADWFEEEFQLPFGLPPDARPVFLASSRWPPLAF